MSASPPVSTNRNGRKIDAAEVAAIRARQFPVPPLVPTGPDLPELPSNLPVFKRPLGLPLTCTDEMLIEAVKCYLLGVDEATLGRMLCVPKSSVRYWTDSREWAMLCSHEVPELQMMLKGQLTRVGSMALRQLEDRLTAGDQVFNMQGEAVGRKEIKGRELAEIATRVLEQRANLERLAADLTNPQEKIGIQELYNGLQQYAKQKRYNEATEVNATPEPS